MEGKTLFRRRRLSLTFRSISHTPCSCKWHFFCDSRGFEQAKFKFPEFVEASQQEQNAETSVQSFLDHDQNALLLEQKNASQVEAGEIASKPKRGRIEKEFVHEVYEKIAGHFSETRFNPWPAISNYLLALDKHSIVADVGCGNGKYLGLNS